jgi:hypothetical protein
MGNSMTEPATDPITLGNMAAQILVTRSLIGCMGAILNCSPSQLATRIRADVSDQIPNLRRVNGSPDDTEQMRVAASAMLAKLTEGFE